MAKEFRTIKTGRMYRAATFAKGDIDPEARTVRLTFSSEDPCERWFGMEILDQSENAIQITCEKQ